MDKNIITEEQYLEELKEIDTKLAKGKEEASKMTYEEQVDFFTKFIRLNKVKKMEDK